jgi:chromosome segregation ATPase
VQRLSRQVERLDAQVKKKEHEKQDLKGLLRERDSQLERMREEASQLRRMLSDSVDVEMLKELRARVHVLEEDVRQRDTDVAERSEHINRLQRQLGATSATGGAMTFLNDLIGAKEKFTQEAQKAKDEAEKAVREAEEVRQRMQQVTRQTEDKEHTIRELEHARLELSGKAQQDGQDAEALRGKVKQLEDMQKAQLRSAMDQLVDAVHRNDHLATEVLSLLAALLVQKYTY